MLGLLYRIIIGRFKEKTWETFREVKSIDPEDGLVTGFKYHLRCKETGEIKCKSV